MVAEFKYSEAVITVRNPNRKVLRIFLGGPDGRRSTNKFRTDQRMLSQWLFEVQQSIMEAQERRRWRTIVDAARTGLEM